MQKQVEREAVVINPIQRKSSTLTNVALMLVFFACLATTVQAAHSETRISAEHYARAEQLLKPNVVKLVKNMLVIPHWIGDGHEFWYRRELADGFVFTLVNAESGEKSALFDQQALADWLKQHGHGEFKANELPFDSLEVTPDLAGFDFTLENMNYTCRIQNLDCSSEKVQVLTPEWLVSPDRSKAIKTVDGNIVLVDVASGKEMPLTHDGEEHFGYGIYYGNWQANFVGRKRAGHTFPPMAAQWAPRGDKVLVTRLDERHVRAYPFIESAPVDGSHRPIVHSPRIPLTGEQPAKLDWHVIDVKTGKKIRLDLPYEELLHVHQDLLAVRIFNWDEANNKLYAVAHGDYMQSAHFFEIDLATGGSREIIGESMSPRTDLNSTSYNPPNVRYVAASNEVIWFSQASGWGHLYLYDARTGERKNAITSGKWLVRDVLQVDEERRVIYFSGTHREGGSPYDRYLYKVNFDGSGLMLLGDEKADHMLTSPWNDILAMDGAKGYEVVSPDGEYVVYNYSRVDQPTQSAIRSTRSGELISIFERADATALYAAGWNNPEEFVGEAEDGQTQLWSVVYMPAGLDPQRSYPIIDSQYISPLTAVVPRNFMMAVQGTHGRVTPAATAALEFAVVLIDARGTAYRDRDFMHHSNGNLNTAGFEDHITVIRQLKEKYDWIDIDRVGTHGSSYGGFGTFRAMFEFPEFYKVGVSNVGVGSFQNMYPDYHWEAFHGIAQYANGSRYYSDPAEKPLNYANLDGTLQASQLEGKLLIMMGELDENVLPATTLQTIDALIKADREFDMVYFPSENHSNRRPFLIRKTLDYFVRYLHHQEPPPYHFSTLDSAP